MPQRKFKLLRITYGRASQFGVSTSESLITFHYFAAKAELISQTDDPHYVCSESNHNILIPILLLFFIRSQ